MEVRDDAEYVDMLATLSEGSVRRNFNPYTDYRLGSHRSSLSRTTIPGGSSRRTDRWDATPVPGRSRGTPDRDRDVAQANVAKWGCNFESILIRA